ncbi:hypothetical protein OTU49_002049, partial [Cherax quadricarinatus]
MGVVMVGVVMVGVVMVGVVMMFQASEKVCSDLCRRLSGSSENLHTSQTKMKRLFGHKAAYCTLEVGEEVLAMEPVPDNALKVTYSGLYTVVKNVSDQNYRIHTPGQQ